jgi:hypothetical protein
MNDWSVDNFLERLMPRLQGRHNGVQHSCPDEESLCAYAEDRAGGVVRDSIAAHLKECESCAELFHRLQDFAMPRVPLAEAEWTRAEKRLEYWMDGFLLAETRRAKVAVEPVAVYSTPRRSLFSAWKLQWALGAIATLVISGATYFIFFGSFGGYLQTAMHGPEPTAPIDAQSRPEAAPPIPAQPEATTAPTQTTHLTTQNPPSSAEATRSSPLAPAPAQPAPPAVPNQNAPVAPPASIQVYTAQNPPAPPSNERPGNHGVQQAPPPQGAPLAAPAAGAYQNAAVLTPEVKIAITNEVKAQILAEQVAATTLSTSAAPAGDQPPAALDPKQRTFIVSTALSEQTTDGSPCSLSAGDVLTRIMDTPDTNVRVTALVSGSQRNDCATGSMLAISVWELQNMHNDFAQKIEAGLQKLAENQGKNGMPAGPMAGRRGNPDGQAQPDLSASADLQQQQQDADNAEKDVSQAAAGITPSSFHQSPRQPADSEHFSSFVDDSLRISRGTNPESGALISIAWHPGSQQTNPRPQQAAPAKPAPAPKAAPPPAAPKPAPPAPPNQEKAAQPPPLNQRPALPPQRATKPSVAGPGAKAPRTNGDQTKPDRVPSKGPALNSDRTMLVPKPSSGRAGLPGGGGRETRADGSSVYRDRSGRVTSVTTRTGAMATFDSKGRVNSIDFRSGKGYGVTVNHGAPGIRTVVSEHLNDRGERITMVNTGPHRGYVDHSFTRNGQPYIRRTYVAGGRSYAAIYHGFYYGGRVYYGYVPGYYYAPAFYGWAHAPWGVPVAFAWGWGGAPWYGYYGYYFSPYVVYPGPAFWLTDYVIAESLQAAYEAQADSSSSAMPRQFAPKLGSKSENEFTAVMIPAISDALKSDPVPKQRFA